MTSLLSANPNNSKGRLFKENDLDFRSAFERDRDRIIHSSSFRKLKHKTQVFIESDSDYYRTRLTHSIEVAQISRSLCRALNLNEDLGEVVSLAHDLGHPPFGHTGEKALNECMIDFGGFNHNDQTLRVITKLEKRHPEFDGLNLTWESLEGIVKHNGKLLNSIPFHIKNYNKIFDLNLNLNPHLESQIASVSDDIAYNNHDIEDSIRAKLITIDNLMEINYFEKIIKEIKLKYKEIDTSRLTYQILRASISKMVKNIIENSLENIKKFKINSIDDINNTESFIITMSENMNKDCKVIKDFLFYNVYNHSNLNKKRQQVETIIKKLFNYYIENFNLLPKDWYKNQQYDSKHRIICDYISGMTDRYASKLYKSIYE